MAELDLFVPSFPTISPEMLLQTRTVAPVYPFSSPNISYHYFARNAVWHAVKILGLDKGEVLVPAYHHGVEIEALLDAGAKVKYYRIDEKWDVDLADVERKIGPNTTGLYLTHFAGFPGPVKEMRALADKYNLPLIEDCALSMLSKKDGQPLGVTGDISIFCLYKFFPVPNGGAMIINRANHIKMADPPPPPLSSTISLASSLMLRNIALRGGKSGCRLRKLVLRLGKKTLKASNIKPILVGTQHFNRDHLNMGISSITKRLIEVQDINENVEIRRRNYNYLLENLRDISPPFFDYLPEGVAPLFYPVITKNHRVIADMLTERGIEGIDFWSAFHPTCNAEEFPEVAKLRSTVLELPCHQDLSLATMARIVKVAREILPQYS